MWLWCIGVAWGQQVLEVDGNVVELDGTAVYDEVRVVRGGVLRVRALGDSGSTGQLQLSATDTLVVDASSRIEAVGAGAAPVQGGAGEGLFGGSFPSGGGGHVGAGAVARQPDCTTASLPSGWDPSDRGVGSAGGSSAQDLGGAGGGGLVLTAPDMRVQGTIDVSGVSSQAGGGAGGTLILEADHLDCTGVLIAAGGDGGGGGGGGAIEQHWDSWGRLCATDVSGGASLCGPDGASGVQVATVADWDGDGVTFEAGDCAPRDAARLPGVADDNCDMVDDNCDGLIDEGAASCDGCELVADPLRTYLFCADAGGYGFAEQECDDAGYPLVSILSPEENDRVADLAEARFAGNWWIGADDNGEEGVYEWATGQPFGWANFEVGEPNNVDFDAENCLQVYRINRTWNDVPCGSTTLPAVCGSCAPRLWFEDLDGDGVGDRFGGMVEACVPPDGFVALDGDCDDLNPDVHPLAPEMCNGADDNCDGVVDDAEGSALAFEDSEGDGFGNPGVWQPVDCTLGASGFIDDASDCDDDDDQRYPGQLESCDAVDNDCDGRIDDDACSCPVAHFEGHAYALCDGDVNVFTADGLCQSFGHELVSIESWTENLFVRRAAFLEGMDATWIGANDRDDEDVHLWWDGTPLGVEFWLAGQPDNAFFLEDCAEMVFSGWWNDVYCFSGLPFTCEADCESFTVYLDGDSDGFGDPTNSAEVCVQESGWSKIPGDCNDKNAAIFPGAPDAPGDGIDADCINGDRCYVDNDGDGVGGADVIDCGTGPTSARTGDCDDEDAFISPDAVEIVADGIDQDCDRVEVCYVDADGDGLGSKLQAKDDNSLCINVGFALTSDDCDDNDPLAPLTRPCGDEPLPLPTGDTGTGDPGGDGVITTEQPVAPDRRQAGGSDTVGCGCQNTGNTALLWVVGALVGLRRRRVGPQR